jgi:hypothetical protein
MFPLDQNLLFYVKFFVFVTCVVFWVKLIYDSLKKSTRPRSRRDME